MAGSFAIDRGGPIEMMSQSTSLTPVPGVTFLDHTADVAFVAEGPDLNTAFARAAQALMSVMVDLDTVAERISVPIAVRAADRADLLVEWLTELLYRVEVDGMLFRRFAVTRLTEHELEAVGYGEPRDPRRHLPRLQVKGITYHHLMVEETPTGARVRVVLDV
jgi:SHS2 domain-containing protein